VCCLIRRAALIAGLLRLFATQASACPLCDSETGREVRAGIFGDHFGRTLAGVLAPFPVFVLVVAGLHRRRKT
jgi:hypothetical protein